MLQVGRRAQHDYALFLIVTSLLLSLLAFRDPLLISDGDSYVSHADLSVDFSDPIYYLYPLYWAVVAFFGPIFGNHFPSLLSVLVSACLIISSRPLSYSARYVFVGLVVLNSISFVALQVALKNGLALGFILVGVSTGYSFLFLAALFVHPGVFPVVMLIYFLNKFDLKLKSFAVFFILALFLHYAGQSLFAEIVDVRGYSDEGQVEGEIFSTYLFYAFLSSLYFFALRDNRLKWFFPLMVIFWISLGGAYSFSWRMFAQAIPVAVFLLLLYSKEAGLYKYSFLIVFFVSSVYWAFKWHPLVDYSDGWLGYWLSLI